MPDAHLLGYRFKDAPHGATDQNVCLVGHNQRLVRAPPKCLAMLATPPDPPRPVSGGKDNNRILFCWVILEEACFRYFSFTSTLYSAPASG